MKCSNIHDIQDLISILQSNNDYFPRFVLIDMEKTKIRNAFWKKNLGAKIIEEWDWMISNFLKKIALIMVKGT